ncbi:MAG: hypothetical protein ACLFTT_06115 [Candidatus Hydrogenedentota bacterium]
MRRQLHALIALKLAILRHTWTVRKGASTAVMGLFLILGFVAAVGAAFGLYRLGMALPDAPPLGALVILDGVGLVFLSFWLFGLILDIQRTDMIDVRKMLYLPVSLPVIYGLNYVASLLTPGLVFFTLGVAGLFAGLGAAHGAVVLLALPLAVAFYLALAAWAYYLRGWLAMLMENQRRRQLVLVLLTLMMIALSQMPYLMNIVLVHKGGWAAFAGDWLYTANMLVPPAWLPLGILRLIQGTAWPAVVCAPLYLLIMAVGLRLGYRNTLRYYQGATAAVAAPAAGGAIAPGKPARHPFTARPVPFLDEPAAAVVLASALSMWRHPRIRMTAAISLFLGAIIFFVNVSGKPGGAADVRTAHLLLPAMLVVWPYFNFAMIFFNLLGLDVSGFRAFIILPASRTSYLFAKNLALFPFVLLLDLVFLAGGLALTDIPAHRLAIAGLHGPILFLAFATVGNFLSIYFPYRISGRNVRGKGAKRGLLLVVSLAAMGVVAVMTLPVLGCFFADDAMIEAWDWPAGLAGSLLSLVLLVLAIPGYAGLLAIAGRALVRRETHILARLMRDTD